ncbi:hypothetical protein PORY_000135 [Pneumocystis oryctolagi]|uniref:Uncharacterized protein n=1 Tax=Pneumocystis oryctolagi TaxID=42067 RepID=A0ACB7CHA3_9ASCO|nr:hypothetical protein PORY_000135 [Pneumocystis oryctolagi]
MDFNQVEDKEKIVEQMIEISKCSKEEAVFLLESNGWSLSEAIMNYMEDSKSSKKNKLKMPVYENTNTKNKRNFKTFDDIHTEESDIDNEEPNNLYAGGEKSGIYTQHPKSDKKNIIEQILKKASENIYKEQDQPEPVNTVPKFSGTGYVLGSEDEPSRKIQDPLELEAQKPPTKVTRDLIFWKDGFTIDDGPLMRYDDPSNTANLQAINSGHAPLSLLNVQVGQEVDLRVQRKLDKEYPHSKKYTPFSGTGQRLGSPAPKVTTSTPTKSSEGISSDKKIIYQHTVNEAFPFTTLQIRFGDGSKHSVKFNLTDTIGDIYNFMNINKPDDSRDYILQTIFPNKEYLDKSLSLKDAGLLNAVLIQKYI